MSAIEAQAAVTERSTAVSVAAPPALCVTDLCKSYRTAVREAGLAAALRGLVRRTYRETVAVSRISFACAPGEMVAFLGPNGAGKTTTLKMLSGILRPSSGTVAVLGYTPFDRPRDLLRRIGLVMGQRNQLVWDLPAGDSFEIQRAIYRLPREEYRRTLGELSELLELGPLLTKPVRTLSLGERMKCELAVSLLHHPEVVFLDEPTLGLDVAMQRRIRAFIAEYNRSRGATILLTSHYMADVEALCQRAIVIHEGRVFFDGALAQLSDRYGPFKTVRLRLNSKVFAPRVAAFPTPLDGEAFPSARPWKEPEGRTVNPEVLLRLTRFGELVSHGMDQVTLRVGKACVAETVTRLVTEFPIADLSVEEPSLEDVLARAFAEEAS